MNCTRCQGTGFLNLDQVPAVVIQSFETAGDHGFVLDWIYEMDSARSSADCSCHISPPCYGCTEYSHDVQVCDCCGDGETWYGEPGEHANFSGEYPNEPFPGCY
jgi:hypothetical protein